MITYYFNGIKVPREGALKAWRASKTYRNANAPESIFTKAERGIDEGGVRAHLAEARIRIEIKIAAAAKPSGEGSDA